MPYLSFIDRVGERDGRSEVCRDHLFLMTENGTVCGARTSYLVPHIGENLFDTFLIGVPEREELFDKLHGGTWSIFLLQGKTEPILILRHLYSATGLLLAVVPEDKMLRRILQSPRIVPDAMPQLLVSSRSHGKTCRLPSNEETEAMYAYLTTLVAPFFCGAKKEISSQEMATEISLRTARCAALCGCFVEYDLTGMPFGMVPPPDTHALLAFLVSVCLFSRRVAKNHGFSLFVDKQGTEGLVINAIVEPAVRVETMPEFAVLSTTAQRKGALFAITSLPGQTKKLYIRQSLCRKELSLQGVKNGFLFGR